MATLSAYRHDLFAIAMLPAVLKSLSEGTLVAGMHRYFLVCFYLVILCIFMRMQRISVFTSLLFGAYLAVVDELSILTFKPKIFLYFAGNTRKRRQIIFTKFNSSPAAILPSQRALCVIEYNSRPLYIDGIDSIAQH